jgi:hypothetical protein
MASGHVNRAKRPNTWAHRPMLHAGKKLLPTRSRPHMGVKRTGSGRVLTQSGHRASLNAPHLILYDGPVGCSSSLELERWS